MAEVSPARWLSCSDLDTADAELSYHDNGYRDNGGHLLAVSTALDGMTTSDPELYSCSSMSVIHTTQPQSTMGPAPLVNGISLLGVVTSEM